MSISSKVNTALGAVSQVQGLLGAASSISGLFAGNGLNGSAFDAGWRNRLQPASFGGVPFGVFGGQIRVGRRNAVHEYPFKDQVWVEDMGRAARRITLRGFLVENARYGGGDVIAQRERLIAACEAPGKKTLVHPTLGALNVALIDSAMDERWDNGRVFEISLSFIEEGERSFPSVLSDTRAEVKSLADLADAAVGGDFASSVSGALAQGASVVGQAVSTASTWANTALNLANDATNLMHMVNSLPGANGRYFGGRTRGIGNLSGQLSSLSTIPSLIAAGTVARSHVASAVSALTTAAQEIAS
ncbi:DNA circularization N-terminal domain-containing protein [Variovorax sp. PAMC26660]|uniref:DNA circularization N-terminal domain-containing protein n=1 Tax=Variovorax sp. PAMC26660 TaxID=2762322 RepID=UPI00164E7C5E|nr:DNA circularization N-terminal domain-containing protein [Variovorax sp. PAMC26660]QNK65764.1 DNA circularization N-terminal domain-containing protein [Variovorax sp. PAMC26660]